MFDRLKDSLRIHTPLFRPRPWNELTMSHADIRLDLDVCTKPFFARVTEGSGKGAYKWVELLPIPGGQNVEGLRSGDNAWNSNGHQGTPSPPFVTEMQFHPKINEHRFAVSCC